MIVNAECGAFSMKLLQCFFYCGYAKRVGAESRIKQRRVRKKSSRYLMKMKEILTDIIIKISYFYAKKIILDIRMQY